MKQYKIAIIGGSSCSKLAKEVAHGVGYYIIKEGHILYTGGAAGVGDTAEEGGLKAVHEINGIPYELIFICNPFFETEKTFKGMKVKMGDNWEERRKLLIQEVDGAIAISGGFGTSDEINKCDLYKKPIIPIGGEGAAEVKRQQINGHLDINNIGVAFQAVMQLENMLRRK